jgi:hypothetical protein
MGTEAKESHRLMAGYFSRPAIMDTENQKRTAFPAVLLIFAIDICLGRLLVRGLGYGQYFSAKLLESMK